MSCEKTVLCVGMLNCDVYIRNMPDDLMQADTTYAHDVTLKVGGDAANVALNLSKMGLHAKLVANVEDNVFGNFGINLLEKEGVDISSVYTDSKTGSGTSLLFFDRRNVKHSACFWGGNTSLTPDMITDDMLEGASHMHIGSLINLQSFTAQPTRDLIRRAKEKGLTVSVDVSGGVRATKEERQVLLDVMSACDIFTLNEGELQELLGTKDPLQAAEQLRDIAPRLLILKLGKDGLYATDYKDLSLLLPSFADPESIVDTTGAGDAFISGFIAGLLHDCPIEQCLVLGATSSALCLDTVGASVWGIPFEKLLEKANNNYAFGEANHE